MNRLSDIYYTTESYLFPMVEEIGEITGKMKEFLRIMLLRIHDFLLWIVVEKKVHESSFLSNQKIFMGYLWISVKNF